MSFAFKHFVKKSRIPILGFFYFNIWYVHREVKKAFYFVYYGAYSKYESGNILSELPSDVNLLSEKLVNVSLRG